MMFPPSPPSAPPNSMGSITASQHIGLCEQHYELYNTINTFLETYIKPVLSSSSPSSNHSAVIGLVTCANEDIKHSFNKSIRQLFSRLCFNEPSACVRACVTGPPFSPSTRQSRCAARKSSPQTLATDF